MNSDDDLAFCQWAARQQKDGRFIVTREDGERFFINSSGGELVRYRRIDEDSFVISRDDLPTTNEDVLSFVQNILGVKLARGDDAPLTDADFVELRRLIEIWYEMSSMEDSIKH